MTITKSDFLLYRDCPLHLWAKKHDHFEENLSAFDKHLIEQGYEVEKLAVHFLEQKYSGSDVEILTQQTFSDSDFEARCDVLVFDKTTGMHDLFEIKSSTHDKDDHLYDITFQALILQENIQLRNCNLVTINNQYVRHGDVELKKLFRITNVNPIVNELADEVLELRGLALSAAESDNPSRLEPCVSPKTCPCLPLCHPDLPEASIYDMSGMSHDLKWKLRQDGILKITDIPENFPLSHKQRIQVNVTKSGKPIIDRDKIRHELEQLVHPLCFFDYETYDPAIPMYEGYKPFQAMVFQYSLHILETPDGEPKHVECVVDHGGDPGIEIAKHMYEHFPKSGSVIVWYKAFESSRNKELAAMYPQYRDFLLDLNERMYDLSDIINFGFYVHPDFKGSYSIKNVLPVMVPELSYKELAIGKGDVAMQAWWEMTHGNAVCHPGKGGGEEPYPGSRLALHDEIKKNLLTYCGLDTYAMYAIWKKLV
ncbi:MAG TPA: DUF2779 domain-containing protein, partial [Patescibacteria group bacterium]|nr:DUF2779 domain-containing protein [Patescibacteria group bacterium]